MIVPMNKYSFLVYHTEYNEFLKEIQDLGVVHVIEKESGEIEDEELKEKYSLLHKYNNVINFLSKRIVENKEPKNSGDTDVLELVTENRQNLDLYQQKLVSLKKDISTIEPWGEFNWSDIHKLKENNLHLKFFVAPAKSMNPEWNEKYNIEIINTVGSNVYITIIYKTGEEIEVEAEEVNLPDRSLSELQKEMQDTLNLIDKAENHFNNLASWYLDELKDEKNKLQEKIDFKKVELSTNIEVEDKLMILEGWVPQIKEKELVSFIEGKGIFYLSGIQSVDENPPILLKNNKFARLFEPIGELYTFPDYKELDLTPFFAPFFMMFFGFCLGDVGYGLLILLVAIFARLKAKPNMKPILSLGIYLGIATIIMGTISGTLFGINLINLDYPWLANIKKIMLDTNSLMMLSMAVGFIQTIFGMCLKAVNKAKQDGFVHSLSTIGWIITILGGATIMGLMKLKNIPMEQLKIPLYVIVGIGGFLIFFMNSPGKNVFLNFGLGVWDTYGMASGLLGDLLSYIRLFALGISSAVLGNVFNDLAFNLSPQIPVIGQIVTIFILLFGHGLNLFMSALGSFVHPLRLTFVEFYKNAGFAGGGKKYSPFKKLLNN